MKRFEAEDRREICELLVHIIMHRKLTKREQEAICVAISCVEGVK